MAHLDDETRLPLMDLAMPSLRSMSMEQFERFAENIKKMVRIDEKISLSECIMEHVVVRRLEKNFIGPEPDRKKTLSLKQVSGEVSSLLSLLADVGHEDSRAASRAFARVAGIIRPHGIMLEYRTENQYIGQELGEMLDRLAGLGPEEKKILISAAFQLLVHDRKITMQEAELFRLLVYGLDTPLPPWVKI
jgi:hypothetical protein